MLRTLFRKELLEQWRTRRLLIMSLVLGASGLLSPLLARLTPLMVRTFAERQPGVTITIPDPTLADALHQYCKNLAQFGVLLVVLLGMGAVAGEKERGTAVLVLGRPVRRRAFLLAKLLAQTVTLLVGTCLAAAGCYLYATLIFAAPPLGAFLGMTGLLFLFCCTYLTWTLLASTLTRSVGAAAGLACAGLFLLVGLGSVPGLGGYTPGGLLGWAHQLAAGSTDRQPQALLASLILSAGFVLLAHVTFRREELRG
jgi:ABC-2 type transport system permease protein